MVPNMKQRGFTVIELVIAVTIAGFLLAAMMPIVGVWMRNTRIRTAAESMSNGLMQARNEAVRRNQPVSFYLVSDTDAVAMSDACALSDSSAGWVVALASPAGKCTTDRDSFHCAASAGRRCRRAQCGLERHHRHVQWLRADLERDADQLHPTDQLERRVGALAEHRCQRRRPSPHVRPQGHQRQRPARVRRDMHLKRPCQWIPR